jgi:putative SOS response-associated peptidase YedK
VCGRYTLTTRRSDEIQAKLADTLGVETPSSDCGFERFNIAPTQEVLAVVDDRDGRRIEELRWGLVPHWAKELNTRFSMINARAETLDQRPAYRVSSPGRTIAA